MGNIQGKFAEQNDIVTTGQIISSNNNQTALNAVLAETNHLRGTNVTLQQTGLLATPANLVPNVTTTVQGTIGAALGGIGQAGTPSEEPGGGGIPCFNSVTTIKLPHNGYKYIREVEAKDVVMAFDPMTGELCESVVTDTFTHLRDSFLFLEFEDGHSTGVDKGGNHKYWTQSGLYAPVIDLEEVWHWNNDSWDSRRIISKKVIEGEIILYNFTVRGFHNYIANDDAVSNLKRDD